MEKRGYEDVSIDCVCKITQRGAAFYDENNVMLMRIRDPSSDFKDGDRATLVYKKGFPHVLEMMFGKRLNFFR